LTHSGPAHSRLASQGDLRSNNLQNKKFLEFKFRGGGLFYAKNPKISKTPNFGVSSASGVASDQKVAKY
jgi:hypothetical protein